jgi:C1A family cysteine protease
MKNNKIQILLAVLGMSLLWVGCKKEASTSVQETETAQFIKSFGVVEDDPSEVRKVPLIMSSDFSQKGYDVSSAVMVNGRGKPVKPPTTTGDATAPTVTITSPANGSSVSGNITISATATDNIGVTSVGFAVDGTTISTLTAAPYSVSWNSQYLGDGTHTITATAKDAAGNTKSTAITVAKNTVIVVTPPPSSTIPTTANIPMPAIGYQGSEGSCVTFAAVYYMRSAEQYKKSGASSYSFATNVMSPEFVYNQTKASTSCSSGSSLLNTLNFMYSKGVCTWQSMPYTSSDCSTMPTSAQLTEATNYKITGYSQIVASDQTAIKTLLSTGHPVVFTFTVDANFYNAGPGYIWNSYSSTIYGPHALTLCGYDDSKRAYRAINQWGTTWGDAGYVWIDYNFFPTVASSVYTIRL